MLSPSPHMDDPSHDPPLFTHFDDLTDTLKVHWKIPDFLSAVAPVIASPLFQSPVDVETEFWLEVSSVATSMDCSRLEGSTSSQGDTPPAHLHQEVLCLHLHRRARLAAREIAIKYLIGFGGPHGMMKMLTQVMMFTVFHASNSST